MGKNKNKGKQAAPEEAVPNKVSEEPKKEEVKEEAQKEVQEEPMTSSVPGRRAIIDINRTYRLGDTVPEIVVNDWKSRGILTHLLVDSSEAEKKEELVKEKELSKRKIKT